jgi:hypothetical protein
MHKKSPPEGELFLCVGNITSITEIGPLLPDVLLTELTPYIAILGI